MSLYTKVVDCDGSPAVWYPACLFLGRTLGNAMREGLMRVLLLSKTLSKPAQLTTDTVLPLDHRHGKHASNKPLASIQRPLSSPQPPNLTTSPAPTSTHLVPHPLSLTHPSTSSAPSILLFNHFTLHPLLSSGASCALIHVPTLPSSALSNSNPPGAPRTTLPPRQEGLRSCEKAWMRAVRGRADCGRRWDWR